MITIKDKLCRLFAWKIYF